MAVEVCTRAITGEVDARLVAKTDHVRRDGHDRVGDVRHRGHAGVDQRDIDTEATAAESVEPVAADDLLVDARDVVGGAVSV